MFKYCVSYLILGNSFVISTNSIELITNQVNHIAKFCYSVPSFKEVSDSNQILIEYYEDEQLFLKYKTLILASNFKIISTFEKEKHAKALIGLETCFMQLPDKYIVRKITNKHYIVIGNSIKDTTKYVFRLIREIIVRIQENKGKLFMHATSLVVNDIGISIVGNSGSGKTTYFSKLLSKGGASIISNDRTFFYFDNNTKMDYFPIPIVYKIGAVEHNFQLKKYILESDKYILSGAFKEGNESLPVPLTDVCNFFSETTSLETSKLDMIIFSEIDFKNQYIFESRLLSKNEAIKIMLETCFTPIDRESLRKPWIYPRYKSDRQFEIDGRNLIEQIIDNVPICFVRFGKDISVDKLYFKTINLI